MLTRILFLSPKGVQVQDQSELSLVGKVWFDHFSEFK